LWAKDEIEFPDSRVMALKRLVCAERKAKNQPGGLEAYNAKIMECVEKGYVRKLTPQEAEAHSKRTWYTPHSCVFNTNKVPVKLRWILDLAAEVQGISVNTELLKGPDIYVSIIAMICQFRERPIAVTGDIKEMFLRVKLRKEDHQSLRLYWRNGEERIPDAYEFQVVPFGSRCSPCIAQYVKNVNADRFALTHPEAVQAIKENHYVDDLMISFKSENEAIRVTKDVIYIHQQGGMEIRGFLSNSRRVMQEFNQEKADEYVNMNIDCDVMSEKVLGQWWHLRSDTIAFKFKPNKVDQSVLNFERAPTKSELLSIVMSIYDPMGFIAHYISYAKIIMREVVKQATAWNQPISDAAWMRFQFWWKRLKTLEEVKIPRWYATNLDDPVSIELHVFCDASDDAYAAVAYLRVEGRVGTVELSLVGAKTRVAPVKITSTPRLELQGAVLATRWADTLVKSHSLKFDAVHFHTDSMTVIGWLRCIEPRKYKPFVAFRIGEILHSTTLDQWHWVPSKLNIADDATKFENVPENPEEDRWFQGAEFLKQPPSSWPQKHVREEPTEEKRAAHLMTHRATSSRFMLFSIPEEDTNTKALMTWNKAVNSVAFVFRAVNNFKILLHNSRNRTHGASMKQLDKLSFVRASERKIGENFLLQKSQWESYSEELHILKKGMQLSNRSELKKLSPIIMEDGLIHMRSRLEYSKFLPNSTKFPIILARNHVITKMITINAHERFCHQSHEAVVQELNMRFKIPAIRQLVKEVKRDCAVCKIRCAQPAPPEMAPLP
jgi:DNA segregation ATPase FtsK/SpoIIIE-like protein